MKIKSVASGGIGEEIGLRSGDVIDSINGDPVRDQIDYRFNIADEEIDIVIKRNNEKFEINFDKEIYDDLGLEFEEIQYRDCASKCVFCFIDQNPEGMRETLYFRDEDFRLSFMHGSYFTLNNVSKSDMNRMVKQRLSPLYISVHALDDEVRSFLFGVKRNDRLLEKMTFLTENGIELHTQVVLCPKINDGDILLDTLSGLEKFFPGVKTVALVPLGMTKYREGITPLAPVTKEYAKNFIKEVHKIQKGYIEKFDDRFVYLADEWYLKGGVKLPPLSHYGELNQLENGVGMTRQFIKHVNKNKKLFTTPLKSKKKIHLMTGRLAEPIINEFLTPVLEACSNLDVSVHGVTNNYFGDTITVSGLLTGRDFIKAVKDKEGDMFLLPPNILNPDDITLDNMTIEDLRNKTGKNLVRFTGDLKDLRKELDIIN